MEHSASSHNSVRNQNTGGPQKENTYENSGIIDAMVKAHNEAESWQTKRQILLLFAKEFVLRSSK